jgi:hypothetical protein
MTAASASSAPTAIGTIVGRPRIAKWTAASQAPVRSSAMRKQSSAATEPGAWITTTYQIKRKSGGEGEQGVCDMEMAELSIPGEFARICT